jgi:hypothetical protein
VEEGLLGVHLLPNVVTIKGIASTQEKRKPAAPIAAFTAVLSTFPRLAAAAE